MLRYVPLWIVSVAIAAGCQKSPPSTVDNFGQFQGNVVAAWDNDGRNMILRETFAYIDSQNRTWIAPAGSKINGASIPSAFWSAIGGPFEGKYRNASVVHDVGCVEMRESWEDVHRMFYEACRCGGVDELKAKMIYYAVYHFGPRWQPVTEVVVEQRATPDGQIADQEVAVQRVVRTDPPPPTPDEIQRVEEYVAEENPEPEAIRKFNRDELRRRPRRGDRVSRSFNRTNTANSEPPGQGRSMHGAAANSRLEGRDRSKWAAGGSNRTAETSPGELQPQPVPPEEQQRLIDMVGQYIEQQAGEPRPAEYAVERAAGGFNVEVRFLTPNDEGQLVPYDGGSSTVRVSRRGQILEITNGVEASGTLR